MFGLSYAISKLIPIKITGSSISTRIGFGYAMLLIGCGFSVRYSIPVPYNLISILIWISIILFALNILSQNNSSAKSPMNANQLNEINIASIKNQISVIKIIIVIACSSAIFFVPEMLTKTLILQNKGPDLDGHLLSTAFLIQGGVREDLLTIFGPHYFRWNDVPVFEAWDFPDFVSSVALEFLYRSNRVSHAGLVASLYQLTNFSPALILISCMCWACSLTTLIIFDLLYKKGLFLALSVSAIFILSQSVLIQRIEGIVAQLIALPLITLALLQLNSGNLQNRYKFIGIGILLCAISQTFGEGAQFLGIIFITYFVCYVATSVIFKKSALTTILPPAVIAVSFFLADPLNAVEFIKWTFFRAKLGFSGGALGYNWSFLDVLFNLPHFRVVEPTKVILETHLWTGIAIGMLALAIIKIRVNDLSKNLVFILGLFSLTIPYFIGHQYAFWKCETIFLPFLLIAYFSHGSRNIKIISIPAVNLFAILLAVTSLWGGIALTSDYLKHAARISLPGKMINEPKEKEYAVVTNETNGNIYFKYGQLNKLYWLNSGWQPNFKKWHKENLPVYGLIDCSSKFDLCLDGEKGNAVFINLNKKVSDYLNAEDKLNLELAIQDLKNSR